MKAKVCGVDLAFCNVGFAYATVDLDTKEIVPYGIRLVKTESQSGKQVRKNSDDLRRGREIVQELRTAQRMVDLFIAEVPHGAQSARASMGFGVAIGAAACVEKPLIEVTAEQVKKIATGRKTASKDEMIYWAMQLYPHLSWLTHKRNGEIIATQANEHMADAIAAIHAGVHNSQQFTEMAQMWQAMKTAA